MAKCRFCASRVLTTANVTPNDSTMGKSGIQPPRKYETKNIKKRPLAPLIVTKNDFVSVRARGMFSLRLDLLLGD